MTGPVKKGLQPRLDNISDPNSTILLVIIYDHNDNSIMDDLIVTVKGFAFFDIEDMRMTGNDGKDISGIFIKKVTNGSNNYRYYS